MREQEASRAACIRALTPPFAVLRVLPALTGVREAANTSATLLVVGGSDSDGTDHSDLWMGELTLEKSGPAVMWTLLEGDAGSPLAARQCVLVLPLHPSTAHRPPNPPPLVFPHSGHVSWLSDAGSSTASLVVFGGQAGTSPQAPFLGDTWAWPLSAGAPGMSSQLGAAARPGASSATWTQLQSAVYKPSPSQPDARANMAAAVPRPLGVLAGGASGSAAAAPLLFGGFSGYEGGLNDLLLNDTWSWAA